MQKMLSPVPNTLNGQRVPTSSVRTFAVQEQHPASSAFVSEMGQFLPAWPQEAARQEMFGWCFDLWNSTGGMKVILPNDIPSLNVVMMVVESVVWHNAQNLSIQWSLMSCPEAAAFVVSPLIGSCL